MKKLLSLVVTLAMLLCCVPAFADSATTTASQDPITITIAGLLPISWNDYPDNSVAKYIKDKFNITIQVVDISDRKEALMASGDLPDLFIIESNEVKPLIDSKFVIPLDDLLEKYGQNIYPNEDVLNYQREAMGDGQHIYGITNFYVESMDGSLWTSAWGLNVDWERYAKLGYPEVSNNLDDIYKLLVDMVNVKPTTDDGLPVYAIAYPTIEMRGRSLYASSPLGYYSSNNFTAINCWNGDLQMLYTDPDSITWQFNHFYWKLNQAGLLDPDSFAMDFDTDSLKAVNGQYVATLYHDITGNATKLAASKNSAGGFQYIPLKGSCVWTGANFTYGTRNLRCISSTCKYPERVMELLNWLYSEEGGRITYSGIEGETWNYADDKVPTLTDEACDAYTSMNDLYYNSGIAFDWNGRFNGTDKCDDGYNANLFTETSFITRNETALQKAVEEHYGMSMYDYTKKMIDNKEVTTQGTVNMRVINALSTLPDDLNRILNEVDAVMNEGMAQCVMATDEDAYQAAKTELIQKAKDMGMEQVNDWFTTNYNELMEKYK